MIGKAPGGRSRGVGFGSMRNYVMVGLAVVVAAAIGLFVWPGHLLDNGATKPIVAGAAIGSNPTPPGSAGSPGADKPPPGAAVTAQQLVTGSPEQQRAALDPQLSAALPQGTMFAPGSAIVLDAHSWRQSGQYANVTGTLTVPGETAARVEIGFIENSGTWQVTFEEQLP